MNRRDALSRVALLVGGSVIGAEAFLSGCKTATKYGESLNFTPEDIAYLNEVAETILPATDTPGAKEAKVGEFMTVIVKDCYEEKDQKTFLEGMKKLDEASTKRMVNHSWKARRSSATTCWLILTKKQRTMVKPRSRKIPIITSHSSNN